MKIERDESVRTQGGVMTIELVREDRLLTIKADRINIGMAEIWLYHNGEPNGRLAEGPNMWNGKPGYIRKDDNGSEIGIQLPEKFFNRVLDEALDLPR